MKVPTFHGRVLVADDNPVNRMAIKAFLQRLGLEVTGVSSGEKALDAIGAGSYCLCLLDLNMPLMNGLDTSLEIRRREKREGRGRLPIVAISGEHEDVAKTECMEAGMDDWLGKPFKFERLCEVLERWTGGQTEGPCGTGSNREEGDAGTASNGGRNSQTLDRGRVAELRELRGRGGADSFTEMVDMYLSASLKILKNLKRACTDADRDAMAEMAHELKSCTLNMGGERLTALCSDLERLTGWDFPSAARMVREAEEELSRLHAELAGEKKRGNTDEEALG